MQLDDCACSRLHVTDREKTTSAVALRWMKLSASRMKAAGHSTLGNRAAHQCAVLQHCILPSQSASMLSC